MADETLRARLAEGVAEALAARPDDGVALSVAGCDEGGEGGEGAVLLRFAIDRPISAGDAYVTRTINRAIRIARQVDPALRALTIDVRVDAAG